MVIQILNKSTLTKNRILERKIRYIKINIKENKWVIIKTLDIDKRNRLINGIKININVIII